MKYNRSYIFSLVMLLITTLVQAQDTGMFSLDLDKKYIVSAWVKETHPEQQLNYENSEIRIKFTDANKDEIFPSTPEYSVFTPSGKIIDGWQRIIGILMFPEDTHFFRIRFVNKSATIDCYFDDVRVYPYNGSMKSFVYDQDTQRLMAELDENNYATLYEYDHEGGLIRVKKETEKGTYTIQESRSGTVKQDN